MFQRYIHQTFSRRELTPDGEIKLTPTYSIAWGDIARDLKRGAQRRARQLASWVMDVAIASDIHLQALRIAAYAS